MEVNLTQKEITKKKENIIFCTTFPLTGKKKFLCSFLFHSVSAVIGNKKNRFSLLRALNHYEFNSIYIFMHCEEVFLYILTFFPAVRSS